MTHNYQNSTPDRSMSRTSPNTVTSLVERIANDRMTFQMTSRIDGDRIIYDVDVFDAAAEVCRFGAYGAPIGQGMATHLNLALLQAYKQAIATRSQPKPVLDWVSQLEYNETDGGAAA